MSDSLNATVIVIALVFTISANVELDELDELDEFDEFDEFEEFEELELPRPPAVVPVVLLEEEVDDELLPELVDDVDPAEIESPR
jgi:hypothetical protein